MEILKWRLYFLMGCAGFLSAINVHAENTALSGLWKTFDDKHNPTGYVRITEQNGIFNGVVEKGLETDKIERYCTECKDERKNQRLVGMTVMKEVKAVDAIFQGSEILDPFTGKTYQVKLKLIQEGKKLEVLGYIGLSLFGRTQIWERME